MSNDSFDEVKSLYGVVKDLNLLIEKNSNNEMLGKAFLLLKEVNINDIELDYQKKAVQSIKEGIMVLYGTKLGIINESIGVAAPTFSNEGNEEINDRIRNQLNDKNKRLDLKSTINNINVYVADESRGRIISNDDINE